MALLVSSTIAYGDRAEAIAATATTYYVNCSAKPAGNGSASLPWKSVAAVTSHGIFAAGDRILFKRNTTCHGQLRPSGSGSAGRQIIIGAYGKGSKPVISGDGTANKTGTIELQNSSYWTIQDLRITNKTKTKYPRSYRSGILLKNSGGGYLHGLILQRLTIDSVRSNAAYTSVNPRWYGGISAITTGVRTDGFTGLQILDNSISHVSRTGIAVINSEYSLGADHGLRVARNNVRSPRGDSIIVQGSSHARVDHNVSAGGADLWPCPECKGISPHTANAAIWPIYSDNVQIDHNEIYGERATGGDGEGLSIDASAVHVTVEYNYIHDNAGGGILFCGSRDTSVRFNILENNKKSALAFIGSYPAHDSKIYNNTIYISKKSGARPVRYFNGAHGSGISFKNNIVFNYGQPAWLWPTKKVSTAANTLVGSHANGRPHDAKTSYADPGLKAAGSGRTGFKSLNGYKPKHPGSFKKGVAIPKSLTRDFFGKKINPKHPPRGAAA